MPGLRKNTLGKNKFFGYQEERIIKSLRTFYVKHLILIKVRTADSPRDSVFIPMCNKRYISKPKNKEIGSVSGKTDSPMLLLSCSPFFWQKSHLVHGYPPSLRILPGLLRSDRGGLSASSPSGERKDACGLRRW